MASFVYKFEIQLGIITELTLPLGAKFLDAAFQGGKLQTWWLLTESPEMPTVHMLMTKETGLRFELAGWKFLKTVHTDNGDGLPYVCHVFQA